MAWRISNKNLNSMLDALADNHAGGAILVYEGSQPVNSHAAPTGTLLGRVTKDAGAWTPGQPTNGLHFAPAAGRALVKSPTEVWQVKGIADGTAGWFRFVANAADSGALDETESLPRIDGRCGTSNAEMLMSSLEIRVNAITTVDAFTLRWPANVL